MAKFEEIFLICLLVSIALIFVSIMLLYTWEHAWILSIPFLLLMLFIIIYCFVQYGYLIFGYNLNLFPNFNL